MSFHIHGTFHLKEEKFTPLIATVTRLRGRAGALQRYPLSLKFLTRLIQSDKIYDRPISLGCRT